MLDRATGEFLAGKSFVKQTWADGLDAKGRAIAKSGLEPNTEGMLVYPSIQGAANWHSPRGAFPICTDLSGQKVRVCVA